jgi:protein-tyrosine-phosphatase
VTALADAEAMAVILDNLVDNAIKYTPSGGRITLQWFKQGEQAVLQVKDTGAGIPAKDLSRVFERFFRVDRARSRQLGGTGLGLSIVKHLVQALGGTISASSQVGAGSTFTVRLPLSEQGEPGMPSETSRKRLVFICAENSNRSQMAEAFAHLHGAGRFEAFSAGSRPSGRVNPRAVESMRELGYDLSRHRSKGIPDLPAGPYDVVVSMGCGDQCPTLHARQREEWNIPDPREMTTEQFRAVRDLVEQQVKDLLARVG